MFLSIRKGLRAGIFLAAALTLCQPLLAEKLVLYHTSDIHGYYFSRPDKSGHPSGGFAVFENVLQRETEPFALLDSGDFSSGNKEANASDGRYSIELMNAAGHTPNNVSGQGYAALTIGNHDSDFGATTLGKMLGGFNGEILSVNVEGLDVPGKQIRPYQIFNWNGKKIAVIGFSMDGPGMSGMELKKLDAAAWEKLLKEIRARQPQAVILLAHDSIADARKPSQLLDVLAGVPSAKETLDVFLGGHAHLRHAERKMGPGGPLFVESGSMLEGASRVVLDFDDATGELKEVTSEYIALDPAKWGENKTVRARLDTIEDQSLKRAFATVPALLPKYPQGPDAAPDAAKLLADYMKKWLEPQERVDFAMFQLPGVRRDLNAGTLTGRDLAELLPYTEYVSTFNIPGKKFKQAAQASLKCNPDGKNFSLFAYSDNLYIEYKCRPNNKKHPVKITKMLLNGKKMSGRKVYRVAAIAHIPDGYFEGAPFKGYKHPQKKLYKKTSGELLFDIVERLPGDDAASKQLTAPQDLRIVQQP